MEENVSISHLNYATITSILISGFIRTQSPCAESRITEVRYAVIC